MPLLDYAATVPADNPAPQEPPSEAVSDILSLPVFQSFTKIENATDSVQAAYQPTLVAMAVVMLRAVAADRDLRGEVRTALLPAFVKEGATWESLSKKLYDNWNEELKGLVSRMVGDAQLGKGAKLKHTRVAAMLMLALLMHHGYVVA